MVRDTLKCEPIDSIRVASVLAIDALLHFKGVAVFQ